MIKMSNKITLFQQVETPEYCYLWDALLWCAFKKMPIGLCVTSAEDRKFMGLDEHEDIREIVSYEPICFEFDRGVFPKYGLPEHPIFKYYDEDNIQDFEYPADSDYIEDFISRNENNDNMKESVEQYKKELPEAIEYANKLYIFECELDKLLEPIKMKILECLKSGTIKSKGTLFYQSKEYLKDFGDADELYEEYESDKLDDERSPSYWRRRDPVDIPKDFWRYDKVFWKESQAQSYHEWMVHVMLDFNDLYKIFPIDIQESKKVNMYSYNNLVFSDKYMGNLGVIGRKGRPSYNWAEIGAQAIKILSEDFKGNQETLIIELQEWHKDKYGKDIGRSTLLQEVSSIFKEYKESQNIDK